MAAALQQQPQLWSVLDAVLRLHGWLMQLQAQQQQRQRNALELNPSLLTGSLPLLVTRQLPTPPLLSMLLSICKLARSYGREHPSAAIALSNEVTQAAAALIRGICWQAAVGIEVTTSTSSAAAAATSTSTSSSSSSSSSNLTLWLCAVTARGLHTLAWSLEQAIAMHVASSSSSSSSSDVLAGAGAPQAVVKGVLYRGAVEALMSHLCDVNIVGIDSATYRQLKRLGKSLLAAEAVEQATAGLDALRAGRIPGSEMQQWTQQLQQFAAAAATAVPLAAACNNPSCSAFDALNEAALVKGRRCSRCKAGYCSDACQAAHWKQHKKACKLLAAAGARAWAL
jgi:hypothetical protein